MSLTLRGVFSSYSSCFNNDKNNHDQIDDDGITFWFGNENGKKTSFIYEECHTSLSTPSSLSLIMEKPCHLFLDCHLRNKDEKVLSSSPSSTPAMPSFLFGGLEIHSNSRNIEVYAMHEDNTNNSFEYLKTCRGTLLTEEKEEGGKHQQDELQPWKKEVYKTIIIPPNSKAIPVQKLHLKLLSLRPAKCTTGYIQLIKIKGRLPELDDQNNGTLIQGSSSIATNTSSTVESQPLNTLRSNTVPNSIPTKTDNNIPNAISAITFLIQNVHQKMETSITNKVGEVQKDSFQYNQQLTQSLHALEKSVNDLNDNMVNMKEEIVALRNEIKEREKNGGSSFDETNGNDDDHIDEMIDKENGCISNTSNNDDHYEEDTNQGNSTIHNVENNDIVQQMQEEFKKQLQQMQEEFKNQLQDILNEERKMQTKVVKEVLEEVQQDQCGIE
jgi:hypothetical protein